MQNGIQICARLRAARKAAGFNSPYEFSQHYTIPKSTYSQHESGSRIPKEYAIKKYAEHLGVNFLWLKTGHGQPFSPDTDERNTQIHAISQTDFQVKLYEHVTAQPVNELLLSTILNSLFEYVQENNLRLKPPALSRAVTTVYMGLTQEAVPPLTHPEAIAAAVKAYFHLADRRELA